MPDNSVLSHELAGPRVGDVRVAGHRALDALYVAVRDAAWGTVPGEILSGGAKRTPTGTTTTLEVRHRLGDISFRWRGTIETSPDRLLFTMDGVAERDFDANRIGFCLLHPQALKGRPAEVSGPSGTARRAFPIRISPDPVFTGFDLMACDLGNGAELEIRFGGAVFETEDHRNWSDPGWKTYCPPLGAEVPVRYAAGQRVRQSVELRGRATGGGQAGRGSIRPGAADVARIRIGSEVVGIVPALGLGASAPAVGRTAPGPARAARDAVRKLRPAYLQVELEDEAGWAGLLAAAAEEAKGLGVPLDVAIAAEPDRAAAIADQAARTTPALGRVSVFSPAAHTTDPAALAAVRSALRAAGGDVPVGGGSRAHFAELNRAGADVTDWDFVTYGLTPTVHHDADDDVLATEAALADALDQARVIAGGRPVVVGPVTLRPRFNAAAGPGPGATAGAEAQPADHRQRTSLAAVYLAAAAARLTGAEALTVFRAVGDNGVVDGDGRPTPAAAVVSLLTGLTGAPVRSAECGDAGVVPLAVATGPGRLQVLVANVSNRSRRLALDGADARTATVLTVHEAAPATVVDPHGRITLPPRSVVLISAVQPAVNAKAVTS